MAALAARGARPRCCGIFQPPGRATAMARRGPRGRRWNRFGGPTPPARATDPRTRRPGHRGRIYSGPGPNGAGRGAGAGEAPRPPPCDGPRDRGRSAREWHAHRSGGAPHRRRRGCRHAGPRTAAYRLGCRGLACARALGHGPRGAHAAATAGGAGRLRFPTPVLFQKLGRRRLHLRRPRGGGPTRRPSRCREIRVAAMARDRAPGRLRESPRCARGADGRRGGGAPHRQARRHSARGHAGHARFGPGPSAGHLGPPSRLGRGAPVLHRPRRAGSDTGRRLALSDQEMGGRRRAGRGGRLPRAGGRDDPDPARLPDDRAGSPGGAPRPDGDLHAARGLGREHRPAARAREPARPQLPDVVRGRRRAGGGLRGDRGPLPRARQGPEP